MELKNKLPMDIINVILDYDDRWKVAMNGVIQDIKIKVNNKIMIEYLKTQYQSAIEQISENDEQIISIERVAGVFSRNLITYDKKTYKLGGSGCCRI